MTDLKVEIRRYLKANKIFYKAVRFNVPCNHMDLFMELYKAGDTGLQKSEIAKILGCGAGNAGRTAEIYTKEGLPGVKASGYDIIKHGSYDRNRPSADVMLLSTKGTKLVEQFLSTLNGE